MYTIYTHKDNGALGLINEIINIAKLYMQEYVRVKCQFRGLFSKSNEGLNTAF